MLTTVTRSLVLPSVDMLTSSCSVSPEMTSVPPVVMSASSRSVSSKKVSHPMLVQVFERHEDWVRCVRFYPDNGNSGGVAWSQWLVDASRDGKMVVSDKTPYKLSPFILVSSRDPLGEYFWGLECYLLLCLQVLMPPFIGGSRLNFAFVSKLEKRYGEEILPFAVASQGTTLPGVPDVIQDVIRSTRRC
ncbi:hypothetical protein PAXINDRAFT_21384 [Paxillus involutus ATCC 200175]|uniref:Uncharacterized protein n=1 Tax=Paxillus involutus ATCC 200175 TaxID=664439 RepID=A0A0C9TAU7_PAXIN|nr:hypothetical protein PAXINDRAFT_21384 [Paxillus involutus ATCC 200175]